VSWYSPASDLSTPEVERRASIVGGLDSNQRPTDYESGIWEGADLQEFLNLLVRSIPLASRLPSLLTGLYAACGFSAACKASLAAAATCESGRNLPYEVQRCPFGQGHLAQMVSQRPSRLPSVSLK
jgi:hypothetical protein